MKANQNGVMEYWNVAKNLFFHSSIIPVLQYSRKRNERSQSLQFLGTPAKEALRSSSLN